MNTESTAETSTTPDDEVRLPSARFCFLGRGNPKKGLHATLRELRSLNGVTQTKLAQRAKMSQGDVSLLESRADHKVSTLRRYVEALGGKLEVVAVFEGDRRVILDDV